MQRLVTSFRPHGNIGTQVLGPLEQEVMTVLWRRGETCGRMVYEDVCRSRRVAYTTVLTIISRLVRKGFVRKATRDGVFAYAASLSEDEFNRRVAREVLRGLVNLCSDSTVAAFVEMVPDIGREKILELSRVFKRAVEQAQAVHQARASRDGKGLNGETPAQGSDLPSRDGRNLRR